MASVTASDLEDGARLLRYAAEQVTDLKPELVAPIVAALNATPKRLRRECGNGFLARL